MEASESRFGGADLVESMSDVEFDAEREVYRAGYDGRYDSASMAVVSIVSNALDRDPTDLPPIHSTVDTGSLDVILSGTGTRPQGVGTVSFQYEGFEVTVYSEGFVEADPIEDT